MSEKRYIGWIRDINAPCVQDRNWKRATKPVEFESHVTIILTDENYYSQEERDSVVGYSTLVLPADQTPWTKKKCK